MGVAVSGTLNVSWPPQGTSWTARWIAGTIGACRVANSAVRYDLQLRGPRQTVRLRSAITARNRIDQAQGAESRPAVPPRDHRL